MAVNEINLTNARESSLNLDRVLGLAAILGAPMLLLQFLCGTQFPNSEAANNKYWIASFGVFYIGGWICGAVGMFRQKVYGAGLVSKIVFVSQILFLTLAFLFSVQETAGITYENGGGVFYGICDAGYPLSHLFMSVVGVCTIRAKNWRGFGRFAPIWVGVSLPLTIALGAILGTLGGTILFGSLTAAGFGAIGWNVFKK